MDEPKTTNNGSFKYIVGVVLIAAIGGSLFGYDQGVISGALNFFGKYFKLSAAK